MTSTWNETKPQGDAAEMQIAQWFLERGWTPHKAIGKVGYDLRLTCDVEVKHDLQAPETGNAAIEVSYNGQPSGIMATGATWWAIVVGDVAFLAKTETLRQLTEGKCEVRAGDGQRAVVRLVPVTALASFSGVHRITLGGQP